MGGFNRKLPLFGKDTLNSEHPHHLWIQAVQPLSVKIWVETIHCLTE